MAIRIYVRMPKWEIALTEPIQVLLVEDGPAAALLTQEALRDPRVPNRIHVVADGDEALRILYREPPHDDAPRPDLILLDLNLPKVDGRDVLARIKTDANLKDIPVVVLTCTGSPRDVEHVYRHQAAGYITKHADLDKYFTAIRLLKELWFNVMTLPKKAA
jgi:CheY-like chemotaxis protein